MSDNLEDMKRMAMEAMKNKKSLKAMSKDINQLKDDTTMLVFQKEEVDLLEALLFDVLEDVNEVYPNGKRRALNMLKHMEAI
jgi:hypothetical protein